jgi:hypothetical protein
MGFPAEQRHRILDHNSRRLLDGQRRRGERRFLRGQHFDLDPHWLHFNPERHPLFRAMEHGYRRERFDNPHRSLD